MRIGYDSNILIEDNKFVGINLGADYCSEHEHGISNILMEFNVNSKAIGFAARVPTVCSPNLFFGEKQIKDTKVAYLFFPARKSSCEYFKELLERNAEKCFTAFNLPVNLLNEKKIVTAWDNSEFAIVVADKNIEYLKILYQAFKDNNIVLGASFYNNYLANKNNNFSRNGFSIVLFDCISKEIHLLNEKEEKSKKRLQKAFAKNKTIKKIYKKYNSFSFVISPTWANETEKAMLFWINSKNIFGWFSEKDLKDWLNEKGPIFESFS